MAWEDPVVYTCKLLSQTAAAPMVCVCGEVVFCTVTHLCCGIFTGICEL